jgi:hypothetical protein
MTYEQKSEIMPGDHVSRRGAPVVTVFLNGLTEQSRLNEKHKLRCIFCALPFYEVVNDVVYITFDEGHLDGKNSSGVVTCKRCKQPYHIVS